MHKITVSKILLATFTPTVAVAACSVITSCSVEVSVSTKKPIVDSTTGKATIDLRLSEQPKDNEVVVSVSTTKGKYQVSLVSEDGTIYDAQPTVTYEAHNRQSRIYVAFKDFTGDDATSSFNLKVKYKNKSGQNRSCSVKGCQLKVHYVHPVTETVHIVDLNDFHGAAAGYGDEYFSTVSSKNPGAIRIAQAIEPILERPGSIFLTAGDNTSGESFSTSTHAQSMFPILKSMKARYCAVGNHAFEWGIDPLANYEFDQLGRTEETEGHYFVTANVLNGKHPGKDKNWADDPLHEPDKFEADYNLWKQDKVEWADPYKILNLNGHLIGLIGLTTKLTLTDGNTETVKDLDFIDYNASIQYANRLCKEEIGEDWFNSIEAFVLLTHIESSPLPDSQAPDPASSAADLAANLTLNKVYGIISAHSHKTVCGPISNEKIGHQVFVGQAETAGRKYLDTQIIFNNTQPKGHRFKQLRMFVNTINFDNSSYYQANLDLLKIRQDPGSDYVKNVIETYDYEKDFVKNKLKSVIAHRQHSLLYPASEGYIGHVYFRSQQICDPLGAWVCLGQIAGFASTYQQEIKDKQIDYPCLSFINIDTINYQLPEPRPEQIDPRTGTARVTLKEMYSIQGYENPMAFGCLSIWQIANIIDYILSGDPNESTSHHFDYDQLSEYFYADNNYNDLTINKHAYTDTSKSIECYSGTWSPTDYKGMEAKCRYPAGPGQWYGMRFEVVPETEPEKYGREYRLAYEQASAEVKAKFGYDYVPKIWIMDPLSDPDNVYKDIYSPGQWKNASYWLMNERLIPVAINSFLDTAGNAQFAMISKYFQYNNEKYGCPYLHFSNNSREMLEELCRMTESHKWGLQFDLSDTIVDMLVTGNE